MAAAKTNNKCNWNLNKYTDNKWPELLQLAVITNAQNTLQHF